MFNEYKLNDRVTLRNKVVVAPMTTWAANDDLTVGDEEAAYYAARSKGPGMVITGCTFFQPNGQGFDNEFYAGTDESIPSLRKMADAIKSGGAKAILQIFHGGRMADPSKGELVSASAVKSNHSFFGPIENMPTPRALSHEEVEALIDGFYQTTRRAIEAGFDGVELHGANTYLLQQFFSPHSNRREDKWGGSLEKRMSVPLAVVEAAERAKKESGSEDFIIGYRFSPEEMEEPGITLKDSLVLTDTLADLDAIDYLHISVKDYNGTSIRNTEDKRKVGTMIKEKINGRKPLIGVGSIYTKEHAQDALDTIGYDMFALGHAIVVDPEWVEKVRKDEIPMDIIDPEKNDELHIIPSNMLKMLQGFPGWFNIKN